MKPAATYPSTERAIADYLTELLAPRDTDATVGITLPSAWKPGESPPHLQVAVDGTPTDQHPVARVSTVRVTVWAEGATEADDLANLAQGLLLAHRGDDRIARIAPLTGVLPATDPDHQNAELASFTVRVSIRSTPIT